MIPIPSQLYDIAKTFEDGPLYLVGGAVRSGLMGLDAYDLDVASPLLPEDAAKRLEGLGFTVYRINKTLGTVLVKLADGSHVEHTTFRSESYPPGGVHQPERIVFIRDLETDALRRDFSINALYYNILTGKLLDPTGGLADLEAGQLRCPRDPDLVFSDDALRLLRLARFAGELDFAVEAQTLAAAKKHAHQLADLSPERVFQEISRILLCDQAYPEISCTPSKILKALHLLRDIGALAHVLPELMEGEGIEQRKDYHAHPVLEHNLNAAAAAPSELRLRFAALLHDVGKPKALRENGRMLGHDKLGAALTRTMLERLRAPRQFTDEICLLIERHMFDLNGGAKTTTLRLRFATWGAPFVRDLAALRRADVWGSGILSGPVSTADRWEEVLDEMIADHTPFSLKELAVTGKDLMDLGVAPGRAVGEILHSLWEFTVLHPAKNEKKALLARTETVEMQKRKGD